MADRHVPSLLALAFFLTLSPIIPVVESTRQAFACGNPSPATGMRFCRRDLPIKVRVRDLIGRLTTEEKIRLLVNNAAAVPRLGISGYEWWSEALHGVSNTGPGVKFGGDFPGATSFPQVISVAASFNASLWEKIGTVVSDEGRAMYNGGRAGLTFWSPNVNIYRDPRWGRGQETPGEDPSLAGKYAASYVRGLQQPSGGRSGHLRLKVAACCKHYTAYDLDNWHGVDRFHFNAKASKQDLEDTFDVPFKTCVMEGRVASVMCSYNQVNGLPTCADPNLRKKIRAQWGLSGYIVSDCDSIGTYFNAQHYTATPEEAVADAIKAGLDLDCGPFLAQYTGSAIQKGKVSIADVDNALANTLTVQMRLGMFDGDPATRPYGKLGPKDVCSPAHQNLALEASRQGIVLLKNDRRALPLRPSRLHSIAVIGPNSDVTATMIGNYAGVPCNYITPLQGISRYARVVHQIGCTNVACLGPNQPIDAAASAARRADAVILVVGLDQSVEAEGRDRDNLLLPGRQQELVQKVAVSSRGPVVLVVLSGGSVDISFARDDGLVSSIVWAGYPGQSGGQAIADVLFGAYNPGGKLPMTWYPQGFVDKVPMTEMGMRADPARGYPGRSYRFYTGPVVYPFGHGLSYSKFSYTIARAPIEFSVKLDGRRADVARLNSTATSHAVRVSHTRCDGLVIPVLVEVRNEGDVDEAHTVLLYSTPPSWAPTWVPRRQLIGFEKVDVASLKSIHVEMTVDVCNGLSFADNYGIRRIPLGEHRLHIGDRSHSISLSA
ncbi:hypothetical protein HPP92_010421 [Vanilla planifolia]|uniref:Fibronectin type III-like domain-containing protein n=1 Tax=Vanilla planifolia TaxID=51239 RepID=A0A835RAE9_VANPL|nr:hypothetical protein HPP92_010421 [Vanilla planifolia]